MTWVFTVRTSRPLLAVGCLEVDEMSASELFRHGMGTGLRSVG